MQQLTSKRMLAAIGLTIGMVLATTTLPLMSQAAAACVSVSGGDNSDAFIAQVNAGTITYNTVIDGNAKKATTTIKNNSACDYDPISISVYKMYDQKLSTQELFSVTRGSLNHNSQLVMSADLPPCMAQIDLWYGTAPRNLVDNDPYWTPNHNPRIFDGKFYLNQGASVAGASGPFCGKSPVCTINCGGPSFSTLAIVKEVRNITRGGTFAHTATANAGDRLEYRITVTNRGPVALSQVVAYDVLMNGVGMLEGPNNIAVNRSTFGNLMSSSGMQLGTLGVDENAVITYQYTVGSAYTGTQICNRGIADATYATGRVEDKACIGGTVLGTNTTLVQAKSAYNDTKNVNATQVNASREDYITYTLKVTNNTATDAVNYVITDDLSGVLPLADMVDLGGGTLAGQVLTYPAITIPAGNSVTKTFKVRVKFSLSTNISYQMINTYGNSVTVVINNPVAYVAPKTGGSTDAAAGIGFAALITGGLVLIRKRSVAKLIFS